MNCDKQQRCEDYLDEEMSIQEKAAFQRHLEGCPVCRQELEQLRELVQGLSMLAEERAPAGAWVQILTQIEAEQPRSLPVETPSLWSMLCGWFQGVIAQRGLVGVGFAAMLVIVVAEFDTKRRGRPASSLARVMKHSSSSPGERLSPDRKVALRPAVRMVASVHGQRKIGRGGGARGLQAVLGDLSEASSLYLKALKRLETMVSPTLKKNLPGNRLLRQTLKELDQAIDECRRAIQQQPRSLEARKVLLAMYERKVELLREILLKTI